MRKSEGRAEGKGREDFLGDLYEKGGAFLYHRSEKAVASKKLLRNQEERIILGGRKRDT